MRAFGRDDGGSYEYTVPTCAVDSLSDIRRATCTNNFGGPVDSASVHSIPPTHPPPPPPHLSYMHEATAELLRMGKTVPTHAVTCT